MEQDIEAYVTLKEASPQTLLVEKKSKFYGYAFPIHSEDQVKSLVDELKEKHPDANHFCYAWQLGVDEIRYRVNDGGEPTNSAGMPIYGQIRSHKITNVLIVVVRIFGGTKLGVGGLIRSYRNVANTTLDASILVKKQLEVWLLLVFTYPSLSKVMRTIKQQQLNIISQKMEAQCKILIAVHKKKNLAVQKLFEAMPDVQVKILPQKSNF
ncbi:MAG: YigZ family protein [Bacteroidota bacterium]